MTPPAEPRRTPRKTTKPRAAAAKAVRPRAPRSADADKRIRKFAVDAARLLHDSHCNDVLLLDVRGKSDVMDYILIGTGTSTRQIGSVAEDVEKLGAASGLSRMGGAADRASNWVVVDLVELVLHIFEPATRAHYDLEMLWGDAPRVPWRRTTRKDAAEPEPS